MKPSSASPGTRTYNVGVASLDYCSSNVMEVVSETIERVPGYEDVLEAAPRMPDGRGPEPSPHGTAPPPASPGLRNTRYTRIDNGPTNLLRGTGAVPARHRALKEIPRPPEHAAPRTPPRRGPEQSPHEHTVPSTTPPGQDSKQSEAQHRSPRQWSIPSRWLLGAPDRV